ncbi:MAG: TIGR04211 family SH3 domain-containing protein [Porticoccaceae bacterium]|nr:TIGR04211 family SH3 domain-containing protein [Porticoccaceae bacterium]
MYKLFLSLLLLALSPLVLAEVRYISDEFRVPLRKSPCSRCAILHQGLKTGLKLNFIESAEGWSHIRTPGGMDGWIENQYIVKKPIARDRIARYQQQSEVLSASNAKLKAQVADLKANNQQLDGRLNAVSDDNEAVSRELADIKVVSANALNLKVQNQKLLEDNGMLQSKIDVLSALNKQLESSHTQKWFIYGAISVFLGALLSVLLPRLKRKRRGHSEWA